jgi:hypothetical protein
MSVEKDALKRLVAPALTALGLVAVGVAALLGSQEWLAKARAERQSLRSERAGVQAKLTRATEEEREIQEKVVTYNQLVQRGIIGEERRLDWVDAISAIKARRKLFDVKYSVEPQRALELASVKSAGDVQFLASRMRLELPLLHEGDLSTFLSDLERSLQSHVLLRSCVIVRTEGASAEQTIAPKLKADCIIDLVTVRDGKRKSTEGKQG